jgi:hypothetical protein
VSTGRLSVGVAAASLSLAIAALALTVRFPLGVAIFVVVTAMIIVLTLAPKLPLLHELPRVGAPHLKATCDRVLSPAPQARLRGGQMLMQIGIASPTRLEDAGLNFLVPEDIPLQLADHNAMPLNLGALMPPTNEPVTPGVEWSHYWAGHVDLRIDSTLIYFVVGPIAKGRQFVVRLKVSSEKLYRTFVADFDISDH